MSETHTSIIEELPEHELDGYIDEAASKPELKETLDVLQREKRRRQGLTLAATADLNSTGVVDALEDTDGMVEPRHVDQVWADWQDRPPAPNYLQPISTGPRFLHAPIKSDVE